MNTQIKEIKKLNKIYKRQLKTAMNQSLMSNGGFMSYLLTYLSYIRDNRILANDLRLKDTDKPLEEQDLPIDSITKDIDNALNEYILYAQALSNYKALEQTIGKASADDFEKNPLLTAALKTCYEHWTNFWTFIQFNISVLEDWKRV